MATRPLAYDPMLSTILARDHGQGSLPFNQMPLELNATDNFIDYTQAVLTSTKIEPPPTYNYGGSTKESNRRVELMMGYKEKIVGPEYTRVNAPYDCRYTDWAIKKKNKELANQHSRTFMPCTRENTVTRDTIPANSDKASAQTIWRIQSKVVPEFEPEGRNHNNRYPSCKSDNLRIKMEKHCDETFKNHESIEHDNTDEKYTKKQKHMKIQKTKITDFKSDKVYYYEPITTRTKTTKHATGEHNYMQSDASEPDDNQQRMGATKIRHNKEGMHANYINPADQNDKNENQRYNRYTLHQKIKSSMQAKQSNEFDPENRDLVIHATKLHKANERKAGSAMRDGVPQDDFIVVNDRDVRGSKTFTHDSKASRMDPNGDHIMETGNIDGEQFKSAVGRQKHYKPLVRRAMFGMENAINDVKKHGSPIITKNKIKHIKEFRQSSLNKRYNKENVLVDSEGNDVYSKHQRVVGKKFRDQNINTDLLHKANEHADREEMTHRSRNYNPNAGKMGLKRRRNDTPLDIEA